MSQISLISRLSGARSVTCSDLQGRYRRLSPTKFILSPRNRALGGYPDLLRGVLED